jgi:hypothetical protein
MSFPIDNQHKSMFHSNEDFGSEPAPLEVIEQQGLTMLKMGEFFEIEITNYNSTNGTLEARFRRVHPIWRENSLEGEVIFKADKQAKNVWSGFPTNIHGIYKWTVFPAS